MFHQNFDTIHWAKAVYENSDLPNLRLGVAVRIGHVTRGEPGRQAMVSDAVMTTNARLERLPEICCHISNIVGLNE